MSYKLALKLIIVLFIFEIGFGIVAHKIKASADSITSATNSSTSQNSQKFGTNNSQLPAEDVAGNDIPDIKRYQYLVRTKYHVQDGITLIEYQTHESEPVLISYYKTMLAKNNWILDSAKSNEINFVKNSQHINIKTKNISGITTLIAKY